jgi:Ca2+-binding EF-hand superfamily protein
LLPAFLLRCFGFSSPFFELLDNVDQEKLQALFNEYDLDKDGKLEIKEVEAMLVKFGVAPLADPNKKNSASVDRPSTAAVVAEEKVEGKEVKH